MSADVTESIVGVDAEEGGDLRRSGDHRTRRGFSAIKLWLAGIALLLAVAAPLWAPLLLRRSAFFRVRRVEILGARYVAPAELLARLRVDTTRSVWDPLQPLAARVASHPEVERASVHRKLPGTLIVEVVERAPVALVPGAAGFRAYDERGAMLPLDPTRASVDAPVLDRSDPVVLRLLGGLRRQQPTLYDRISVVRTVGADELLFETTTVPVRAMKNASLDRFVDIAPVENDLARRHLRPAELDLRYRDQVIARLP